MTAEHDIAWAAGFFDGEGCFSVHRQVRGVRVHHNPRLCVGNTHKLALERFAAVVDATQFNMRPFRHHKELKPAWECRVNGAGRVLVATRLLRPYLTVKAEGADAMIELCERIVAQRSVTQPTTDEEIARRDGLLERLRLAKSPVFT